MKSNHNLLFKNTYFWRNHAGNEIDYIEEYDGKIDTYEFKYGNKKTKIPNLLLKHILEVVLKL